MANLFNFSVKMIINIDFPFTITISRTLPGSVYEIYLNHLVWVFRHQMYNTKIQRLYSRYCGSCCPKKMLWYSCFFPHFYKQLLYNTAIARCERDTTKCLSAEISDVPVWRAILQKEVFGMEEAWEILTVWPNTCHFGWDYGDFILLGDTCERVLSLVLLFTQLQIVNNKVYL